jgi:hypothetical protein
MNKYENIDEVAAAFRKLPGVVSVEVKEETVRMVVTVVRSREDRNTVYDKESEILEESGGGTEYRFRVEVDPQVTFTPDDFKRKGPLIDRITTDPQNHDRKIVTKPESHDRKIDPEDVAKALGADV